MIKYLPRIIIALLFCFANNVNAQGNDLNQTKYLRSSLYLDLISLDEDFGDEIPRILNELPFPDKYNNHNEGDTKSTSFLKIMQNYVQFNKTPDLDKLFQNYIDETNLENKLIATWFNRKRDGTFNMDLVAERGFYDATQLEADIASNTVRGRASLADAGENLIQNTFVVLGLMYVNGNHKKFAIGSNVRLYKLTWNEEKAAQFYQEYWIPNGGFNLKKRKAFEEMDLLNLEFIGDQSSSEVIKVSRQEPILELPDRRYFTKRLPRQIKDKERFKTIVTRHFDEVYANLQKKHTVFRVITPLTTVEPLTAQIGMKEGLKGGEKFEVLEQNYNVETGKTTLKRQGTIKVVFGKVWDNRFNVSDEEANSKRGATTFEGRGDFYSGMLIRQID